jgi:hypothetical protein
MANQRLPILRVVQVGNDDFYRYQIADEQEHLWNGEEFQPERGILYADHNVASTDVQSILKKNFEGVKAVKYVVPLYVEVFSNEPLPVNDVALYLSKTSQLFLNTTAHGNGPGSSLVLPQIEWHRIKQIKESPNV